MLVKGATGRNYTSVQLMLRKQHKYNFAGKTPFFINR